MKQNIKNTLYRFVTMRAPELIGDEEKAVGFVQFPEGETSAFLTPVSQATTPETKKQAVTTAIAGYTPTYASKEALKAANTYLYDFATWLTSNRTKFSLEEITDKVDEFYLPNSTIPNMVEIWDDLHYNILTTGNSYLRDLLLSYLVADFFLTNRDLVERTAAALQKVAQAKVIIDKGLFSYEITPSTPRTPKVAEKHFKKEMNAVMANQNLAELEAIAKKVSKVRSLYDAENQKAKAARQITYDAEVKTAYDNATFTERVVTDPESGQTSVVKEYTNLVIPDYDFIPANELDKVTLGARLDAKTLQYVTDIESQNNATTLQEIEDEIASEIQSNTAAIFENTSFELPQIVVPGGLSVLVSNTSNVGPFSYSLCPRRIIGSSLYNLLLVINIPNSSYDVVRVTCDANNDTFTDFEEFNLGAKIALALCSDGLDFSQPIALDITVEFSNGEKYSLEMLDVASLQSKCYVGQMDFVTDETSSPSQAPVAFGIQRLGIADYRKIEQEVCCYVPGEVSHIENIMAREYKSKEIKRTRRQETTDTFSSKSERENLTETTSTDRFEMNQEIASMTAQDQSANATAGVHWGGDKFGGNASASFANNTSSEESNNQAITHAKELTERALDRVVQKVREERVSKVIEEYEENTSHGFDNRKGDKHISGVYRWVDKVYRNKILNYGKRLMYEFMIPEPASFHELAVKITNEDEVLVKPLDPRTANSTLKMENFGDVDSTKYKYWASIYNAEVTAMPTNSISISKSYSKDDMAINEGRWAHAGHESVEIPENYYVFKYSGYFSAEHGYHDGPTYMRADITIGGNKHILATDNDISVSGTFIANTIIDSLDFAVSSWDMGAYALNLRVDCILRHDAYEAWQIQTFNTIIEAYEERLAEYNEKYAAQQEKQQESIDINPGFFREIEKTVLRKNCISYILGHENLGKNMINNRQSLTEITANYSNVALDNYAAQVKFFEQAFEWDIMSYNFYPFYWANKQKWGELYQIQNNDPLFRAFLQSGMARVIITVRPGFEEMVNWYMATGQIWNGGQVPTPGDEEFVSIIEELRNPESEVEETWESRVPTSLTVIQAGAIGLNVDGLPCDTDCDDWLQFNSDGTPAVDADGNPISNNPIVPNDDLIGGDQTDTSEGVGSDTVNPIIVQ